MKRLGLAALLLAFASTAHAQYLSPGSRARQSFPGVGCFYNTTYPTLANGQSTGMQCNVRGQLQSVIFDAAGNARGANVNASNQLSVSLDGGNGATVAASQSGTWSVRAVGNIGAVFDGVVTAATSPANGLMGLGIYNSTEPSPTTGQSVGRQLDAKGRQRMVIMDAAGNTRGANVDSSSRLSVSVDAFTATNASTNVAQINAVTPLMGNGVTGTGSLRVTIASDNTANSNPWLVTGSGTAGTAASGVVTVQGIASMTPILATVTATNLSTNVAQINGVTPLMGNGVTGTGSLRVTLASDTTANSNPFLVTGSGTAGSAATGVVTIQGIASMTKLLVTPDANSAVNLAQVGGTTVVNGGLAGSQSIGGTVATNVAITDNPVNTGGQAVSSENAAVTTARKVQFVADLVGKQIVLPYANPENFVSGAITTAMTSTTSTSLVAAPASGLRNYITNIVCSNAHATVGTDIIIQDGSGGTTLYTIPAAPAYGGSTITFPTPLRQPTTATAVYVANVTTGASTKCSATGYKGA